MTEKNDVPFHAEKNAVDRLEPLVEDGRNLADLLENVEAAPILCNAIAAWKTAFGRACRALSRMAPDAASSPSRDLRLASSAARLFSKAVFASSDALLEFMRLERLQEDEIIRAAGELCGVQTPSRESLKVTARFGGTVEEIVQYREGAPLANLVVPDREWLSFSKNDRKKLRGRLGWREGDRIVAVSEEDVRDVLEGLFGLLGGFDTSNPRHWKMRKFVLAQLYDSEDGAIVMSRRLYLFLRQASADARAAEWLRLVEEDPARVRSTVVDRASSSDLDHTGKYGDPQQ